VSSSQAACVYEACDGPGEQNLTARDRARFACHHAACDK
jgi:hypothetical protein